MFQFIQQDQWPPLAWLAKCEKSNPNITVFHGPRVEVCDEWFCEAVWDGEFQNGNFDQTDIVAGSGGRARGVTVIFVSAGNTVDRLQSIEINATTWVSNSLACLTAGANASVPPAEKGYYVAANSVIQGLDRYQRTLSTSVGDVQLTYFDNLCWNQNGLQVEPKPCPHRDFSSFERYRAFLQTHLNAVVANLSSIERRHPLRMMGTLSSGYDSTAVSALAKPEGLREVITFDRARGGDNDSGEATAKILDLQVHRMGREAWREMEFAEVPFIASYSSGEDIIFKGAEPRLRGCVLLTGYYGGLIWAAAAPDLSDQLVRHDSSGLALTEYRLWEGFIHCAVPFWGAKQIRDIDAISKSEAMKPWNVPGRYNRPIARRIGEEAGIPRHVFGIRKRAATVNPFAGWDLMHESRNLLTPSSLKDYLSWISENRSTWLRYGRVPPIPSAKLNYYINMLHMRRIDAINSLSRLPLLWKVLKYQHYQPQYLNHYLFPWALDRAMRRYIFQ
ncbi:MAG: hypothetical protein ABIW48_08490 [Burkholderiales bacterium]